VRLTFCEGSKKREHQGIFDREAMSSVQDCKWGLKMLRNILSEVQDGHVGKCRQGQKL
jgi:hypothetical protein